MNLNFILFFSSLSIFHSFILFPLQFFFFFFFEKTDIPSLLIIKKITKDNSSNVNDIGFVVVQSFSHVQLFATPWTAAYQASLSLELAQTDVRWVSDAI